ncbi:MAG: LptA/OstA family protein [Planctomycetota bacterium]|jgi:hypothetical protein
MKRFAYIVLLSAVAVLVITLIDLFFSEEEIQTERSILDRVSDRELDLPIEDLDEAGLWNVKYPRYEMIPGEGGKETRVQTALFLIEHIKHIESNEYEASNLTFEFYEKGRQDVPAQERIVAKGKADKARLFTEGESELSGMDMEFKSEFMLQDNVIIDTFDPKTGKDYFNLKSNDLIFQEESFESTQEVTISREGFLIQGEGLFCDLSISSFTLHRNIRIEGTQFDFSRAPSAEDGVQPDEEPGTDLPPMTITASGSLELNLAEGPGEQAVAFNRLRSQGGAAMHRLRINENVHFIRDTLEFRCDKFFLDFIEAPDGQFEIRSLRGEMDENRTTILFQDYTILCDVFDYWIEDGRGIFLLRGNPRIDQVALPLFAALSKGESEGGEPVESAEPTLLDFMCKDEMRVEFLEQHGETPNEFGVSLSGDVVIQNRQQPEVPMLEADTLSFIAMVGGGLGVEHRSSDTAAASDFAIQNFKAEGSVSGRIDQFDLVCHQLNYNYIEAPDGTISMLSLMDPEESRLDTGSFSLYSPEIRIDLRPDLTNITSSEVFRCSAVIENLPAMTSFNLFAEDEAPTGSKAASTRGTIEMEGRGDFRLLVRDEGELSRQNILIKDSPRFEMHMLREGKDVLAIEGVQTFSLVMLGGELDRLHLDDGGKIDCPELGFSTLGESLFLEKPQVDVLKFVTSGTNGTAFVSFTQPEKEETCNIHADRIQILTGKFTELIAENRVRADIPLGLFQAEEGTGTGGGTDTPSALAGNYRIGSDVMVLERPEGSQRFTLTCEGNSSIASDEVGLDARCDNFTYRSEDEILALKSPEREDTVIKIRSRYEKDSHDSIHSQNVDINLRDSTARIYRGGIVRLTHYDPQRGPQGRITIDCENEINLNGNLLLFQGPLFLVYQAIEGEDARTLACTNLSIWFERSPLLARIPSMDLESYKALVKGESIPQQEDPDWNMVRRMRAQDDVLLEFKTYSVACARLTWDLLKDDIRCEGLGSKVRISIEDRISIQGGQVLMRPVNEEFTVINR